MIDPDTGLFYICGEQTLAATVKPKGKKWKAKIVEKLKGKDLVGIKYVPLFDYFANEKLELKNETKIRVRSTENKPKIPNKYTLSQLHSS